MQTRILLPLTAALVAASLHAGCLQNKLPLPDGDGGGGEGAGTTTGEGGDGTGGTAGAGQGGTDNSGGAGGGTGGSGGDTGTDTCPGDAFDISLGVPLTLGGTTTGFVDDYTSYCGTGTGSGPDTVYQFTPTSAGTMTVELTSFGDLNGVLYAQDVCGGPSFYCSDRGTGIETLSFDAQVGEPYYIVVDGRDQTEGAYTLSARLDPAVCGDGVINAPQEECDFGDTNPGDGCDATCQFEIPTDDSDTCPGQLHQASISSPLVINSFTTGYTDDYTSCGALPGSPDRVFAVFASSSGTMTVTLPNLGAAGGGFDGVLAAWGGSCDAGNANAPSYLGCSDGMVASDEETLSFAVTAGSVYFIVVDGYASYSFGNFTLTVTIT
ncbi:hypothetical protein [Chondromyces crocatus]|uniref:Peptidase C-terminal archaeal/bacterial domain-containing protein n=1 Tax=Chondromyces crocatus TaxID=52 RepID=A0A0K1ERI3_CHOCO|nr:hypothetical protein [Chondromyces crocatus]AKT43451.1 uncharacterized protein CMC5_076830 [Chondromyces crocatus]